jgi:excisionase family DNA binding protein
MNETLLVGVREAAKRLGLGRDTAYQLVREGRLHSVAVGRKRLVPVAELGAFIERETSNGNAPGGKSS